MDELNCLRRGPITAEQLAAFGEVVFAGLAQRPEAPGQLPIALRPADSARSRGRSRSFVAHRDKRCGLLAWQFQAGAKQFAEIRQLSSQPGSAGGRRQSVPLSARIGPAESRSDRRRKIARRWIWARRSWTGFAAHQGAALDGLEWLTAAKTVRYLSSGARDRPERKP